MAMMDGATKRKIDELQDNYEPEERPPMTKKQARKFRKMSPQEHEASRYKKIIEAAVKDGDAATAIDAFKHLKSNNLPFDTYVHRVVINACTNAADAAAVKDEAFEVYDDLQSRLADKPSSKSRADETVYSALIKLSAKTGDFERCHQLLKTMEAARIEPRLRTFSSLLTAYADAGDIEQVLWVYDQLHRFRIELTETEYISIFRACVQCGSSEVFSRMLAEYIDVIAQPGPEAWEVFKQWFASKAAQVDGRKWTQSIATVNEDGVCSSTNKQLQSLELSDEDQTVLLEKIESLVRTDDKRIEQWAAFKEWLTTNGPFDVLIDAANVGYFNQNFSGGGFSYRQIELMVEHYEKQGKKVLVVLHKRRTYDDIVPEAYHAVLRDWTARNIMYNCRSGNNDDWYWLYAAVQLRGRTLVVTNDEMRDHHFQMIHDRSFRRWKARHQVHYAIHSEKHVKVHEPPVYSARPQRLGDTWHFPQAGSTEWLCFALEPTTSPPATAAPPS